jgi:hypothetical protein
MLEKALTLHTTKELAKVNIYGMQGPIFMILIKVKFIVYN